MFKFDRRLFTNLNWGLLLVCLLFAGLGLINLYSATVSMRNGHEIFIRQLAYYGFGASLALVVMSLDYRFLLSTHHLFYGLIIVLLVAALVFGQQINAAQRWINLGFFRLQPSEPAKLVLVVTLAAYYSRRDCCIATGFRDLLVPMALTLLPFVLIMKQPDLGTAMMLFFIFASMTLVIKVRGKVIAAAVGLVAAITPVAWFRLLKPYQKQRILTLFNPERDAHGSGYHIIQSKIAVGSGMLTGKGYMQGTQVHLNFLPERHTDFIFSVLAEEWGFLGSMIVIGLFFLMVALVFDVAANARDKFGSLLAFGIGSLLLWQGFINIGMILGILPVVGMPLPLFSYGGSSLVTTIIAMAIVLNVSMRKFMAGSPGLM
jgi:rod shape determining protein RodA